MHKSVSWASRMACREIQAITKLTIRVCANRRWRAVKPCNMESGKDTSCRFSFRKGPKIEHTIDFTLKVYAQPPSERLECIWWIFRKQRLNLNASCKRKKGFKDSYSVLPFAGTGNRNKLSKETKAANPTIFEQIAQAMVQMIWHLTTVLVICLWTVIVIGRRSVAGVAHGTNQTDDDKQNKN